MRLSKSKTPLASLLLSAGVLLATGACSTQRESLPEVGRSSAALLTACGSGAATIVGNDAVCTYTSVGTTTPADGFTA